MDLQSTYNNVYSPEIIYENYIEDKLEHNLVIPDYFCAAQKIVHCEANAIVMNKNITDDKVILEGICVWKILYVSDEDDLLHHISCEHPFTEYFSVQAGTGTLRYKVKTKNVICKLQSPQRADCKATLCIALKITDNKCKKILSSTSDDQLQLLQNTAVAFEPKADCEKEFKVVNEISFKQSEMDVYKATADLVVKECKCLDDKVILKGTCKNKIFLISNKTRHAECVETETSFNQIMEVQGIGEKCIATSFVQALECDTSISSDENDNIIVINTTGLAHMSVYCPHEFDWVSDAYHPSFDIETDSNTVQYYSQIKTSEIAARVSHQVHQNTKDLTVLYSESKGEIEKIGVQDNVMIIDGKVTVSFLYKIDDELCYNSYSIPFQTTKVMDHTFERLKCDAQLVVDNLGYIILNDMQIEVTCDCRVILTAYLLQEKDVLTDIKVCDSQHEQVLNTALVIYYGTKGETLWDIGKKYFVPINVLKNNNELSQNQLDEDKLIFISKR